MSAEQIRSEVEKIVKAEWERIDRPIPPGAGGPSSARDVGWDYRISPPFPAAWPPDGKGAVYYYAYAAGFSPGLVDAEVLGSLWARVKVDTTRQSAPRLEVLAKEIKEIGPIGVRPLTEEEIAVYDAQDSVVAQVWEASRKTDPKALEAPIIRQYYCAWSRDSGMGEAIQAYHSEFFQWLGCK